MWILELQKGSWYGLRRRLAIEGGGRRPSSKAYSKKVREA